MAVHLLKRRWICGRPGFGPPKERIAPLFTQKRVAASACAFLDVLIGNEPRKTGWMRAEAAGDPGPWRQQALLGHGHWDADAPSRCRQGACVRASGH